MYWCCTGDTLASSGTPKLTRRTRNVRAQKQNMQKTVWHYIQFKSFFAQTGKSAYIHQYCLKQANSKHRPMCVCTDSRVHGFDNSTKTTPRLYTQHDAGGRLGSRRQVDGRIRLRRRRLSNVWSSVARCDYRGARQRYTFLQVEDASKALVPTTLVPENVSFLQTDLETRSQIIVEKLATFGQVG